MTMPCPEDRLIVGVSISLLLTMRCIKRTKTVCVISFNNNNNNNNNSNNNEGVVWSHATTDIDRARLLAASYRRTQETG